MTHLQSVQSALQSHLPELRQRYPIAWLALFGSVTRDDFRPGKSDIDVMVAFEYPVGYEFIELAEELERLTGSKIDLISRNALKPNHWDYIKNTLVYV